MGVKPECQARRLWAFLAAAVALVLVRSFVLFWYEQNFDSDQAIVGLMAKHLSEFRALPLFFYGQHYMLGVEAWIAVPFFWLGGPTVMMLRAPLVVINAMVTVLLIRLLTANGVRPALAFVAVLPFTASGVAASTQLTTALGASVEPLLYVLILWMLRDRPALFGMVLCVGSLHREFTWFAVPPILLLQWLEWREIRWRSVAIAVAAFGVVWIIVDQLKQHVNIAGPGGATVGATGSLTLEAVQVWRLLSFHPSVYLSRLQLLLREGVPDLFGARPLLLATAGVWGDALVGSSVAGAALAGAAVFVAMRLVWITAKGHTRGIQMQVFLALVAMQALVAYPLHGGTIIEPRTELNYILLVLLLPVALFGAYFQLERNAVCRWLAVLLTIAWAVPMMADHGRVIREYAMRPPGNIHRILADYLTSHRIKYAWAGYWDSYRVTFLSRERVIVASTDTVRIPGYQARVEHNAANAARIVRMPCGEGTPVVEWCVVDPFQR
jgi:hypothetical protein